MKSKFADKPPHFGNGFLGDLKLTARSRNALFYAIGGTENMTTKKVVDKLNAAGKRLTKYRNLGPDSETEILREFKRVGLELKYRCPHCGNVIT